MDQNVIKLTKLFYKKSLLAHLVGSKGSNLEDKIKAFNLRDAVCLLANAWSQLQANTIKKCWNVLISPDTQWDEEDDLPLAAIKNQIVTERETIGSIYDLLQEIAPTDHVEFSN